MLNKNPIRILLADDNPSMRSALALLLETRLHANIVGESHSMEDLLSNLKAVQADILLLDSELPGAPTTDRVAFLHRLYPKLKVVMIGSQPGPAGFSPVLRADAYINRSEPPEQMVKVLQAI